MRLCKWKFPQRDIAGAGRSCRWRLSRGNIRPGGKGVGLREVVRLAGEGEDDLLGKLLRGTMWGLNRSERGCGVFTSGRFWSVRCMKMKWEISGPRNI